jgi:hypothetical protein
MPTRRKFIRNSIVAGAALSAGMPAFAAGAGNYAAASLLPVRQSFCDGSHLAIEETRTGQRKFRSRLLRRQSGN